MTKRSKLERQCPKCGVGIIGAHMRRHIDSAVCLRAQRERLEGLIRRDVIDAVNARQSAALTIPVITCDMNGRMTGGVMLSLSEWLNVMLPTQRREDA